MKTKKLSLLMLLILGIISCGEQEKTESGELVETMTQGKIEVFCDESVYGLLDSAFIWYDKKYPQVTLSKTSVSSRKAMSLLLSGNSRVIVNARAYLKDEEKLMEKFAVDAHKKLKIAYDGLVFFTKNDSKLDTLNKDQLHKLFTQKNKKLSEEMSEIDVEPRFVIHDENSSEYANMLNLIAEGKPLAQSLTKFSTPDSVINFVENNDNTIGIAYLSQLVNHKQLKMLRMGFQNEKGRQIYPQIVHQAYIALRKYPYPIEIYAYLLEDRKNLPFWFASFLAKEKQVQLYLKNSGIVPAYAEIKLIKED